MASAPPRVAKQIVAVFEGSWFAVRGCEAVARTREGSRPGVVLADAIFNLVAAPVLADIAVE
eukprot:8868902-Lingulodinium_polyedra.AAC.1